MAAARTQVAHCRVAVNGDVEALVFQTGCMLNESRKFRGGDDLRGEWPQPRYTMRQASCDAGVGNDQDFESGVLDQCLVAVLDQPLEHIGAGVFSG